MFTDCSRLPRLLIHADNGIYHYEAKQPRDIDMFIKRVSEIRDKDKSVLLYTEREFNNRVDLSFILAGYSGYKLIVLKDYDVYRCDFLDTQLAMQDDCIILLDSFNTSFNKYIEDCIVHSYSDRIDVSLLSLSRPLI